MGKHLRASHGDPEREANNHHGRLEQTQLPPPRKTLPGATCNFDSSAVSVRIRMQVGRTAALRGCPDIFELAGGDFAVIGSDITDSAHLLPPDASCGPDERMVRIPRQTLVLAKPDIPNAD